MATEGFMLSGPFINALTENLRDGNSGVQEAARGSVIAGNSESVLVRLTSEEATSGDFAVYKGERVMLSSDSEDPDKYIVTTEILTFDGGGEHTETNVPLFIYERNKTTGLTGTTHEISYEAGLDGNGDQTDKLVFSAASGSGTVSETPWLATFDDGELVTWSVPAGGGNDEILPDILTMTDGLTELDDDTLAFVTFDPINYGPDDGDSNTDERVLTTGQVDWYTIQLINVHTQSISQVLDISNTEPVLTDAPFNTRWKILFNVTALDATHPNGNAGTKFTIQQVQFGAIELKTGPTLWALPAEIWPVTGNLLNFGLYRAPLINSRPITKDATSELQFQDFDPADASLSERTYFDGTFFPCTYSISDNNYHMHHPLF